MPFESKAQQGFLEAHPEKIGGRAKLKEWEGSTDFSHLPEHKHMAKDGKKKHHGFSHSTVQHHHDGSRSITHHHESGDPKKNVSHAVADLDGVHDSLEHFMGEPNEGEEAMAAGAAGGGAGAAAGAEGGAAGQEA